MWWLFVVWVVGRVMGDVAPQWWDSAVYYRMMVDSFRDGDGDGLGDLRGEGIFNAVFESCSTQ